MAVTNKTINVANGDNQRIPFYTTNTELTKLLVHIIVRDIDAPVLLSYEQGNEPNQIDIISNQLTSPSILAPITDDCLEGEPPITTTINDNGNYFIAVNSFYGKYGNIIVSNGTATGGTIQVITNTIKKV